MTNDFHELIAWTTECSATCVQAASEFPGDPAIALLNVKRLSWYQSVAGITVTMQDFIVSLG